MKLVQRLILFTLCLISIQSLSGQGVITGVVSDSDLGETLISAYVFVEGTDKVVATDFDGKYSVSVLAGVYSLKITYIGFSDKVITDVEVKDNETTYIDIIMSTDTEVMEEVVISAKAIERSENSVLLLQKKSIKIQDGISAQELSKQAVGNVASAMKKITGATVQDGKYLNVRGLGDRYSIAQLDGISIPSVDPYSNSASLDFIPTNIIDNIIASKTFTPDQPGTFTGGNVNIKSKSFPEKETFKFSLSSSYNNVNNLQDNFYTHEGGSLDWLGYDNGERQFPQEKYDNIKPDYMNSTSYILARPTDAIASEMDDLVKSVNFNFEPEQMTSPVDHGMGISYGNRYKTGEFSEIGLLASASYARTFRNYVAPNDRESEFYPANFWRVVNENSDSLFNAGLYDVRLSTSTPEINTFVGLAYKINQNHTITLKNIYNHQSQKASRELFGFDGKEIEPDNDTRLQGRSNTFNSVGVNSTNLTGEHLLEGLNNIQVEWTAAYIRANRIEPGLNYFTSVINTETNNVFIPKASVAPPTVIWRYLYDTSLSGKLDITIPFKQFWASEFKVGGLYTNKVRDFNEYRFRLQSSPNATPYTGDLDAFLGDDNMGWVGTENDRNVIDNYIVDDSNLRNSYAGESNISAAYGMWVGKPAEWFRFVIGGRYERTDMYVESDITKLEAIDQDSSNTANLVVNDFLPAVSLIFGLNENINLRVNYAHTIARPNLREIAPFAAFDPLLNAYWLGNTQLQTTDIYNYDIRLEWFMNPGEIFAISGFYKDFRNPISQSIKPATNLEYQFVNVPNGVVSGIEFEIRKSLGIISTSLSNFKIGGNISIIRSSMDVPENAVYKPEVRTFEGQSPILGNAFLSYDNDNSGTEISLSYNYQGRRLYAIGNEAPDEYINPFQALDFAFSQRIANKFNVKVTATNLLGAVYARQLEYKGVIYETTAYQVGRTFGIGISYSY